MNSFIEKNRSAAMIGLHDTVNRHSGMIYLMYRASTPCLSLWDRRPSAARSEGVDTFFRPAVRAGLPPPPAGGGIPEGRGRGGPRPRPGDGRVPHPPTGSDNHRTTPRDAAATDPPKPNRGGGAIQIVAPAAQSHPQLRGKAAGDTGGGVGGDHHATEKHTPGTPKHHASEDATKGGRRRHLLCARPLIQGVVRGVIASQHMNT